MTMENEYYFYPKHEDLSLLDSRDDAMSSSSDSDRSQDTSIITLSGEKIKRKWIKPYNTDDLDSGLRDLFRTIVETVPMQKGQFTVFPSRFHEEMKTKNNDIINSMRELNYEHCFALGGNSLVSTLNIANNLISVPKGIRCDICIVSSNNPVILLTFVEDETNIGKKEKYNELLTRELTNILRTYMDESVSIVSGVVAKGTDLKAKIKIIQDDVQTFFANTDSMLSPDDGTLESAITALLIGISRAPTYQFIEKRPEVIWTLSPGEVEEVLEHLQGGEADSYRSSLEDPGLILEIAARKSRRRSVRLDLTKQQHSRINMSELRRWYPNLEVTAKAVSKQGTIHGKLIRVREETAADMDRKNPSLPSKRAFRRRRKAMNLQRSNAGNGGSNDAGSPVQSHDDNSTQRTGPRSHLTIRSLFRDFRLRYYMLVLWFLAFYHTPLSTRCFCTMKCLPLLYLIYVVGKDHLHGSTHKKNMLLFGLVCSCVGDAMFVWKPEYFELGLTFFSLAHIAYGFGFGLKPIGLKRLLVQLMLTFTIFFYFTWKLQGITWMFLFLYAIALNIMIWRVMATVCHVWSYELVGAVCFLIANIYILVRMSETPYPFSHQISMTLYYTGQLGMVISILKKSREEFKSPDCKHRKKVFYGVLILYIILSGLPSLNVVLKRLYRNNSSSQLVSEILFVNIAAYFGYLSTPREGVGYG